MDGSCSLLMVNGLDFGYQFTAVSGLVSHRKAPGSNLASWQIVWLIQAAIAVS
jgi:hypothetical protein